MASTNLRRNVQFAISPDGTSTSRLNLAKAAGSDVQKQLFAKQTAEQGAEQGAEPTASQQGAEPTTSQQGAERNSLSENNGLSKKDTAPEKKNRLGLLKRLQVVGAITGDPI